MIVDHGRFDKDIGAVDGPVADGGDLVDMADRAVLGVQQRVDYQFEPRAVRGDVLFEGDFLIAGLMV